MAEERPPAEYRVGADKELHDVPDANAEEEPRRGQPLASKPAKITRHVTKRNGSLEGESTSEEDSPEKERQRDLTSLSGPVPDRE